MPCSNAKAPDSFCPGVVTLSVRTAWDLWLQAMAFPPGSEIIVSSVTIPEMARIIELNGLVVVPVDVDPNTLAPDPLEIEGAITDRTRAILVAHLFGVRLDLGPVADIASRHDLLLVEDCAQAYIGPTWTGTTAADVSLFSFGPIKTQTTLGGGLVRLRDLAIREKMLRIADGYRRQTRLAFVTRVMKYAYFKFLTSRIMYGIVASLCTLFGRDLDSLVRRSVRNFSGDQLLAPVRRRPSAPLVRLLLSRLRRFDADRLRERARRGEQLQLRLQCWVTMPGEAAAENTYWLFPIIFNESAPLIDRLRSSGYDASRNHSLVDLQTVARQSSSAFNSDSWLSQTVFLPCYPEMPIPELERIAEIVLSEIASRPRPHFQKIQALGPTVASVEE
jgi:dTDP-4-amino-4,6-dideoxygalactose transaminase